MTERYTKAGETIRDNYTERHYPLDEVPFLLNQLYRKAMITVLNIFIENIHCKHYKNFLKILI